MLDPSPESPNYLDDDVLCADFARQSFGSM